jgi:hypothetical protein
MKKQIKGVKTLAQTEQKKPKLFGDRQEKVATLQ